MFISYTGRSAVRLLAGPAFLLLIAGAASGAQITKLNDPLVADGDVERVIISPDESLVVYIADQDTDQVFELYSVPQAGGAVSKLSHALPPDVDVQTMEFTPDGSRVVYTIADATTEIRSVPVAGGAQVLLASGTQSLVISADSSTVVYRDISGPGAELFGVPVGGGAPTLLSRGTATSGGVTLFDLSTDGTQVLYQYRETGASTEDLYRAPIGGGVSTVVNTPLASGESLGFFTHLNDRVVYEVVVSSTTESYFSASISGGAPVDLTPLMSGFGSSMFGITFDGARFVFEGNVASQNELYSVPILGGVATKISGAINGGSNGVDPFEVYFSPDSTRMIFLGDMDTPGTEEAFSVPVAGGSRAKLNGPLLAGGVDELAVASDSSSVAYLAREDAVDRLDVYVAAIDGSSSLKVNAPFGAGDFAFDLTIDADSLNAVYWRFAAPLQLVSVPLTGGSETALSDPLLGGPLASDYLVAADSRWAVYIAEQQSAGVREAFYSEIVEACPNEPSPSCVAARKDKLTLVDLGIGSAKNKFKLKHGGSLSSTTPVDFGDPTMPGETLAICIYDFEDAIAPLPFMLEIPTGTLCGSKPCWKASGAGFRYKDRDANAAGIAGISIKTGDTGRGKISIKGGGSNLVLPGAAQPGAYFNVDTQLLIQLHASESGNCFESSFEFSDMKSNSSTKAKGSRR